MYRGKQPQAHSRLRRSWNYLILASTDLLGNRPTSSGHHSNVATQFDAAREENPVWATRPSQSNGFNEIMHAGIWRPSVVSFRVTRKRGVAVGLQIVWKLSYVLAAVAVLHGCSAPAATQDAAVRGAWPMYQRGPTHNAVLDAHFNAGWSFNAGSQINGGLALVGKVLFADTFDHDVFAIDATTGTQIWRFRADDVLMSTPVVADNRVFVGSGHNGRLHQTDPRFVYTPTDGGDPTWGQPQGDAVIALNAASGTKLWSYKTVGEDMPSAALVRGSVILANGDLHAYALHESSGRPSWIQPLEGVSTMASATAANGRVFFSVCSDDPFRCETIAADPSSGRTLWRSTFGNSDSSPTLADGMVFVSGVRNMPGPYDQGGITTVAALDERTGRTIWSYADRSARPYTRVASNERAITGTFADGVYYQAIPSNDEVIAFKAKSGRIIWRFHSMAPVKMSPVVSAGRVYFGDVAGVLYVVQARSGALFTTRTFSKPFTTSPPILAGNILFIANYDSIYAIRVN